VSTENARHENEAQSKMHGVENARKNVAQDCRAGNCWTSCYGKPNKRL